MTVTLNTDRLLLRQWKTSDFPIFAALNADQQVMKYFPKPLDQTESDAMAKKCMSLIATKGWGFWAIELQASGEFIGLTGLHEPKPTFPFSPCIEVGWRLHKDFWGNGYATEAATAALKYAFEVIKTNAVLSFTATANTRSKAVMTRIGMCNTHQNFNHPELPNNHALSEHALYRITKPAWLSHNHKE